jgi:hypothetical protein
MPGPDADADTRTSAPVPDTRTFVPPDVAGTPTVTHPPHSTPQLPLTPFADRTTPFGPPGFDLLGKIAEGGMGVVYQARDRAFGRVVALKAVKLTAFNEHEARQRFTREVRAMAGVEHPNLVPVYQSGEHNGVPYFTMKYMPGGTLAAVRKAAPLAAERVVKLLRAIAGGVAAMHAKGYLHRDLKPSNVLLDDAGTPHVADFGLVKWADQDEHTLTGVRNGTPQYMSPEQVAGRSSKLTAACDVWALGVIGYELACGRRPFDHDDHEDLYRAITHDPVPDPRRFAPDLSGPLADVLLACLCKDPLGRYPTAGHLAADLDRLTAGQPVQATELLTLTKQHRPTRRRWLTAVGGAFGVAAAGGVAAAVYHFTRKPAPPEPTFAEAVLAKLEAGEPADLIGDTGGPQWKQVFPADSLSVTDPLTVAPNPVAAQPFNSGWLDLFATPIPRPFRFEAEVRFMATPDPKVAFVGVYVGRRLWEAAGGVVWHTAAILRHSPSMGAGGPAAELVMYADPVKDPLLNTAYSLAECGSPLAAPPADGWVRLAVELRGDKLTAECHGARAEPRRAENGPALHAGFKRRVERKLNTAKGLNPQPVPVPDFAAEPSLFGPALGVFVCNATADVRSARLVPLPGDRP